MIASVYRIPSKTTSINEWNLLLNLRKDYKHSLIEGDLNSHHYSWGSNKICNTGENLIEALADLDLTILNNKSHTYYSFTQNNSNNSTSSSILQSSEIDLTLVSSNLHNNTKWEIFPDIFESDHFPISITLQLKCEKVPFNISHKLHHKHVNWKEYESQIDEDIANNIDLINNYNLKERYNS